MRLPPKIVEERNVAVWRYRLFKRWFHRQYILSLQDKGLNPYYLFNKTLIDFATALCHYANRWEKNNVLDISAKNITKLILNHMRKEWQDLLGAFEKSLAQDPSTCCWFGWRGGKFYILPRDDQQVWYEALDWDANPVYTMMDDEEEDGSSNGEEDA